METRAYATEEGIRPYLDSLEGLHQLAEIRRAAGQRREHLPVFAVLGRYLLLADGGIGDLLGVAAKTATARAVMSLEDFTRFGKQRYRDEWHLAYRVPARLAPVDATCPECERGWTIKDCHDALIVRETRIEELDDGSGLTYQFESTCHEECKRVRVERDERCWAEYFLERVGLPDAQPEMIYGRIKDDPTPWFRLETSAGAIRFGRRGVGFGLEWKETARPLPQLFRGAHRQGHKIEHGEYFTNPPDEEFLLEHFNRLREALGF